MKLFRKLGLGLLGLLILFIFVGMYGNAPKVHDSGMVLTNNPEFSSQLSAGQASLIPQNSAPTLPPHILNGAQVVRSILGLEVKFFNGNVNYPGIAIVNDSRYQALSKGEKLVDSIKFQPLNALPFLLLIAIAKNDDGAPIIVPGKFDIVHTTKQNGFVLKDPRGRLFYYSGYILATPVWKGLNPGQNLQDRFCKDLAPVSVCAANNIVSVILNKPLDPRKDIPFLTLVH